jgi:hypothetical protein
VHPEYLSDEVSGPEDEGIETQDAWKVTMAALAGMSLAPETLTTSISSNSNFGAWVA